VSRDNRKPFLVWIYGGHLDQAMDSATWLDTSLELRKMGWQVLLVAAGPSSRKSIDGTEVYCVPMPNIYLVRHLIYHLGIYWLLLHYRLGMDIILFDRLSAIWLLPVKLVCKLLRKQRPLFVIDVRSLHMPPPGRQGLKVLLRGKFQDFVGRESRHWVNGYVTITSRLADFIQTPKDMLWGTWPSGVSLDLFKNIPQAHLWPSQSDPVRLIYIGTLNIERNLMNFCRAVEKANSEGMFFELWLVGDGDERDCLVEFARGTQERIKVKRPVPHIDIPQLLAKAHVGVLPFPNEIKFQVSSPVKLFEYMAAGMPILATRIDCHTDVAGEGKYVFWAENADLSGLLGALQLTWKNRDSMKDMGILAASAAHSWTWHESALKLSRALEYGLERNLE